MADKSEMDIPQDLRNGHPSEFVPASVKRTSKQYHLLKAEAIVNEFKRGQGVNILRNSSSDYEEWRNLASGNQSVDFYKPLLNSARKRRTGSQTKRDNLSYRVLDWSILAVAPKFVNVLVGRLIGQNNEISVEAVDKYAVDARKQAKFKMQEYILNKNFYDELSKSTGIPFGSPIQGDDVIPPPSNISEIDLHMEMFYKERYCLELIDWLRLLNDADNMPQMLKEIATDLVEVGVSGTKTYRVGTRIRRRRIVPERMITNAVKREDFSDVYHGGEFWDLTVGQLREIAGDQLTEDQYKEIAETATNQQFGAIEDYTGHYTKYHSYPWDNCQITVFDYFFFSGDQETYVIKNSGVYEQDDEWVAKTGGISAEAYKQRTGNSLKRRNMNNLYTGMWIMGTKHVFNFGLATDMLRNESDIGECVGPYMLYTTKFDSIIRQLKPVFHNIQLNWLQYQHHVTKSRPMGVDIEYTALQEVNINGTSGGKMTPKEVLELYFDTGVLLWRRKDHHGNQNNWRPINELDNGLSEAARQHFVNVVEGINLLRTIIGLTEVSSAETPNPELLNGVAQLSLGAVDDALKYLHHAFDQINMGTAKRTIMHITAMAQNGVAPMYIEALGADSAVFMETMSEIGAHEYGVQLMREPNNELRQILHQAITDSSAKGFLLPFETAEVHMEARKNVYRAIRLLKVYHARKEKTEMLKMQQMYQAEMQKNVESAAATEAAKQKTLALESQLKTSEAIATARAKVLENKELVRDQILLEKVRQNGVLNVEEERRVTEIMKIDAKGEWDLMIAEQKAKEAKAKEAAKPKSQSNKK